MIIGSIGATGNHAYTGRATLCRIGMSLKPTQPPILGNTENGHRPSSSGSALRLER